MVGGNKKKLMLSIRFLKVMQNQSFIWVKVEMAKLQKWLIKFV